MAVSEAKLEVSEKTLRDLSQSIATHIEPKIFPQIGVENFKDRKCIRVSFSGKEAPYFGYGRVYMRVADEDRQLTVKELEHTQGISGTRRIETKFQFNHY